MSRWKAFAIHLSISAIIALAVLAIMLLVWYPYPLFEAVGGQRPLMILLGVDVILGPVITLAIFNTKKSRRALTFDLSVISLLQLTALVYGMSVVFQARPAYIVFKEDAFILVTANLLNDEVLKKARYPEFRSLPLDGPRYVYTEIPKDVEGFNEVFVSELNGKHLSQLPQFYSPYSGHMAAVGKAGKPLSELRKLNPDQAGEIDAAVRKAARSESDLAYVPLRAKYQDQAVLVGKNDGKVMAILNLNPGAAAPLPGRGK